MKMCSRCGERPASVFITRDEKGKKITEGLCTTCAMELNLNPITEILNQIGISPEDFEAFGNEVFGNMHIADMEGGMFPPFMNGEMETEEQTKDGKQAKEKSEPRGRRNRKSALDQFGTNLNEKAEKGELDPVIGREDEIWRVMQILNRRKKNNPCLVGEPGVGKTAIAEGLAVRIVEKKVPPKLLNKEVYLLDFASIVAGTQFRGQFENRMKAIIEEAKEKKNCILVIDEVHSIVGAGDAEGAMSAANILKPALARGELQIIGATTLDEYRKHIEKDSALERRFGQVIVNEPTEHETVDIINGIKEHYEKFHGVKINDEVVKIAVKLSKRYINDRFLPDKAIDVIDEAGSRLNLNNTGIWELAKMKIELAKIQKQKEEAAGSDTIESYQQAADLKIQECRLIEKIAEMEKTSQELNVTIDDVAEVVEMWTKIPVKAISDFEAGKLLSLNDRLKKNVIGQDRAVDSVCEAVRVRRAALSPRKRPISFIFTGTTGVGKTELVKQLAKELFGTEEAMIRIDMSEYMECHSSSKLIGSPPGYVGYDDAGQLTEKVRKNPYCVILLDEIEKAHKDISNILLQVLDDGRITDSKGRVVNFENTVIIMTSNAGSNSKDGSYGFARTEEDSNKLRTDAALKEIFKPEFLNRVDEIVQFNSLTEKDLNLIAGLMLNELKVGLEEHKITAEFDNSLCEYIAKKGYDPKYGARPMRRIILKEVESKLSHMLIANELTAGDSVKVKYENDEVVVEKSKTTVAVIDASLEEVKNT